MRKKLEITINVPSEAKSNDSDPYIEHTKFIKYCRANRVEVYKNSLEAYEKKGLLYPCFRILYPRELLRRKYKVNILHHSKSYKIRDEWKPLLNLEEMLIKSRYSDFKEFNEAIDYGHPLERALLGNPFVINPEKYKFKAWDRYKVIVHSGYKIRESRAKHYYSPWKIFFIENLNILNTDVHNRATGFKRYWIHNQLRPSSLNEFSPYFRIVASFSYRQYLLLINYLKNTKKTKNDRNDGIKRTEKLAKKLFSSFSYKQWIRFLRKLIELHEDYREKEKIILSMEAKKCIERTVIFLNFATNHEFLKICDDVSGKMKGILGVGFEDGVSIHPGKLEELFPDEKYDLEQTVKWILNDDLERFNSSLLKKEQLPELLDDKLFEELAEEPTGTALAAIRKINMTYTNPGLWRDNEIWSGIRDLAVSIEAHGKDWLGVKGNGFRSVLNNLFASDYEKMRRQAGQNADARNITEFLEKLKFFQKNKKIPTNRRCGRHLLIAYLTRNLSSHRKGLSGDNLMKNLPTIYSSLVRTLFVIYAKYKGL
jgi:hypothetical protein